jgi:hypothetical protein
LEASGSWEARNSKVTKKSNNIKAFRNTGNIINNNEREAAASNSRVCSSRDITSIRNTINSIDVNNSTWMPEKKMTSKVANTLSTPGNTAA